MDTLKPDMNKRYSYADYLTRMDGNGIFYFKGRFVEDNKIPVHIFNGDLEVDLMEVFE